MWTSRRVAALLLFAGTTASVGTYAWRSFVIDIPAPTATLSNTTGRFTGDIAAGTFKDEDVLSDVGDLLQKTFTTPESKAALKMFFHEQFTANEVTTSSLRCCMVDKVVQDPWVSERLIDASKDLGRDLLKDKEVWPDGTLSMLRDTAMGALQTEAFTKEATAAVKSGLKHVIY